MSSNLNVCRVCAEHCTEGMQNIFQPSSKQSTIAVQINAISGLQVTHGDGLPEVCCPGCLHELDTAMQLRRRCIRSEEKLRNQQMPLLRFECINVNESHVEEVPIISYQIVYEDRTASDSKVALDEVEGSTLPLKKMAGDHIQCCGCPLRFPSTEQLSDHSIAVHRSERKPTIYEERPYECKICFRRYKTERGLKEHLANSRRGYQCATCGKQFSKLRILEAHENTHAPVRHFPCSHCGKAFRSRSNLRSHEKLHRSEGDAVAKENCTICGKTFTRKSYLRYHLALHTGETPFGCHLCPSRFKAKANLRLHLRTHTGEKPYACEYCDRTFMYPTDRKRHLAKHTGQKQFKCDACEKGFSRRYLLHKHRRTIHDSEASQ